MMIHTLNVFFHPTEELLMKISEVSTALTALSAQLTKVQDEILGKIGDLEAALNDLELPAEAMDALEALRTQAQSLDDIVPDTVVEPDLEAGE